MVFEITQPVIIAAVISIVIIAYLIWFKNPQIKKEISPQRPPLQRFAQAGDVIRSFPWMIGLVITLAGVILIQSLGYLLQNYFGFQWISLGFVIKGLMIVFLVYLLLILLTDFKAPLSQANMVLILIIFASILFVLFGLEKVVPQLFSFAPYPMSVIFP